MSLLLNIPEVNKADFNFEFGSLDIQQYFRYGHYTFDINLIHIIKNLTHLGVLR